MQTVLLTFSLLSLQALLPVCIAQAEYRLVVVTRNLGSARNFITLVCREVVTENDISDARFYLNMTRPEYGLRSIPVLEASVSSNGLELTFLISKDYEGNYQCGPDQFRVSAGVPLIAHPDPLVFLPPPDPVRVIAGRGAVIQPLTTPGMLVQRYYIDWKRSGNVVAAIQGPRTSPTVFNPDPRYSVDPDTFSLTIQSVAFEDRGAYIGIVGVVEPEGAVLEDTATASQNISLEVSVPPCITGPPQDQIVSLETDNTVTFSCIAEGFPQPAITWQHKGMDISGESIDVSLTASALFRVNSTMTLSGLSSSDSGSIMCMATVTATVTADTGDHVVILTDIAESTLSVFGELRDVFPFIPFSISNKVVYRVTLDNRIPTEVNFYVQYLDPHTQQIASSNVTDGFTQTTKILFEDKAPFQRFKVSLALKSGNIVGPLLSLPEIYDTTRPSELNELLLRYLVPSLASILAGILVLVLIITAACIVCCGDHCLCCCMKVTPETHVQKSFVHFFNFKLTCSCFKRKDAGLEAGVNRPQPCTEDNLANPPPGAAYGPTAPTGETEETQLPKKEKPSPKELFALMKKIYTTKDKNQVEQCQELLTPDEPVDNDNDNDIDNEIEIAEENKREESEL